MSFLNPAFLWGLFALSIPIIVHLFNFRRSKKIYFSNTRFLQSVKKKSSAHLYLKHWLALFSRLLLLTFLVLAFAQPFIPGDQQGIENDRILIYLDNSMSMSAPSLDEGNLFDEAVQSAQGILDLYPRDAQFKILTNDFDPSSNIFRSKDQAEELITELTTSGNNRSFEEILSRVFSDPQVDENAEIDFYFISDYQKSTIASVQLNPSDSINNYRFLVLEPKEIPNLHVDSVYFQDNFLLPGELNELIVRVKNSGSRSLENGEIKLFIDQIQVASSSQSFPSQSSQEVSFQIQPELDKALEGRIVLEDFALNFDNEYYFILNPFQKIKIKELSRSGAAPNLRKVYANDRLFDYSIADPDNVSFDDLRDQNLIICNELSGLSNSLAGFLSTFVEQNGVLMIVPGVDTDPASFSSLLPTTLQRPTEVSKEKVKLAPIEVNHPFFRNVLEDFKQGISMPEAVQTLQWNNLGQDLLTFRSQDPFLTQLRSRNIFLFSSPFRSAYTDFHLHALFVPVMYKIALFSKNQHSIFSHNLDNAQLRLELSANIEEGLTSVAGEGMRFTPAQRMVQKRLFLDLPTFEMEPGFYQLKDPNDSTLADLAFNYAKRESQLEYFTAAEIEEGFSDRSQAVVFTAEGAERFSQEIKNKYEGLPLWKYCLIFALIFFVAEILILRFL